MSIAKNSESPSTKCVECGQLEWIFIDSGWTCGRCGYRNPLVLLLNDDEDVLAKTTGARRQQRLIQKNINYVKQKNLNKTIIDHLLVNIDEVLYVYQYILKKCTTDLIEKFSFPRLYLDVIENIWFEYLEKWLYKRYFRLSTFVNSKGLGRVIGLWKRDKNIEKDLKPKVSTIDHLLQSNEETSSDYSNKRKRDRITTDNPEINDQVDNMNKPKKKQAIEYIPFSLSLILGILYLGTKVLNLGILDNEIRRWALNNSISYHYSTYTKFPENIKELSIYSNIRHIERFFTDTPVLESKMISDLSFLLSDTLGINFKRLNIPLVGMRIIKSLELPDMVKEFYLNFCKLNMYSCKRGIHQPLFHMLSSKVIRKVDIAALIVLSIKCCKDWFKWKWIRSYNDDDNNILRSSLHNNIPVGDEIFHCYNHNIQSYIEFLDQVPMVKSNHGNNDIEFLNHQKFLDDILNRYKEKRDNIDTSSSENNESKVEVVYQYKSDYLDNSSGNNNLMYIFNNFNDKEFRYHPSYVALIEIISSHIDTSSDILSGVVNEYEQQFKRWLGKRIKPKQTNEKSKTKKRKRRKRRKKKTKREWSI